MSRARVTMGGSSAWAALPPLVVGLEDGRLHWHDPIHASLATPAPAGGSSIPAAASHSDARVDPDASAAHGPVGDPGAIAVLILRGGRPGPAGVTHLEVVVGGWRVETIVEDEDRAALRERARRGAAAEAASRPAEVRAIIPGRVAWVTVVATQVVTAGEPLLAVEAMKMHNELRAPRAGTVTRVAVEPGQTIEAGDLLVVIE